MSTAEPDRIPTFWPDSGGEVPLHPVSRLIYASMSLIQGSHLEEMQRIREHAELRNQQHGLRVALLTMSGWFVEWIEGPDEAVQALMQRVVRDPRHHGLKIIHRSVGRPRLFMPWSGAIVQSPERTDAFGLRVFELLERHERGESLEPASIWLTLCSPPMANMPAPLGSYPRVMLLSARGTRAFELLTWLAAEHRQPLVRRRFTGSMADARDVESDYLDIPGPGGGGLRLIANARKALAMGMTHAFLPDYGAVVVLLDAEPVLNQNLVDRIVEACRQVHHCPLIVGVGALSVTDEALRDQVERQGLAWQGAPTASEAPGPADLWAALAPALQRLG
jgi:hypothetical protein